MTGMPVGGWGQGHVMKNVTRGSRMRALRRLIRRALFPRIYVWSLAQ